MIFVRLMEISEVKSMVTLVHHQPDLLNETERADGFFVESIPEYVPQLGKTAELFYNPQTKEFYYEYRDVPTTESERIAQLEKNLKDLMLTATDQYEQTLEIEEKTKTTMLATTDLFEQNLELDSRIAALENANEAT
ncbi:hypothetical protein [uncultured Brevibacillus sp.]|uniref:hypothetical protein n=1 Tax=uncultured Brevibacillus sp. TaxID=169970 RepID=UPI002593C9D7|nr:hypothetical protein [uncultured Brevibacillus sp.]